MNWSIPKEADIRDYFADRLHISPITAQVLINRDIYNEITAKQFLSPSLNDLHTPNTLPNCEYAAERIVQAIKLQQPIYIWGDYDVDGITGTAILWRALRELGAIVHTYIPDRKEGYGLNVDGMANLIHKGAALILTVDCGITGREPIQLALDHNIPAIVTDHHQWKREQLPPAYAIVHPSYLANDNTTAYPNRDLCGAGVAWKLAWQVGIASSSQKKPMPIYSALLRELLNLAALGTIADVVSLRGENRTIAHFGLSGLASSTIPGITALIEAAGYKDKVLTGYSVGFGLGPRINAASRMGHANEALELLTTEDGVRAKVIATELETKNKERQYVEKKITEEAITQAEAGHGTSSVVVTGKDWNNGVVGIVASRLAQHYKLPAIVLADSGEYLHGSGRSIEGYNLLSGLDAAKHLLDRYGGHHAAAGLKLSSANLDQFRFLFDDHASKHITAEMRDPSLKVDAIVKLKDIDFNLCNQIAKTGPYGPGNRKVMLAAQGVAIIETKMIGKEANHLSMTLSQEGSTCKAIWFSFPFQLEIGCKYDFVFEPSINEWNGNRNVQLQIIDAKETLVAAK